MSGQDTQLDPNTCFVPGCGKSAAGYAQDGPGCKLPLCEECDDRFLAVQNAHAGRRDRQRLRPRLLPLLRGALPMSIDHVILVAPEPKAPLGRVYNRFIVREIPKST